MIKAEWIGIKMCNDIFNEQDGLSNSEIDVMNVLGMIYSTYLEYNDKYSGYKKIEEIAIDCFCCNRDIVSIEVRKGQGERLALRPFSVDVEKKPLLKSLCKKDNNKNRKNISLLLMCKNLGIRHDIKEFIHERLIGNKNIKKFYGSINDYVSEKEFLTSILKAKYNKLTCKKGMVSFKKRSVWS